VRPGGIGPGGPGVPSGPAPWPGLGGLGSLAGTIAKNSPTVTINQRALANQGDQIRNNFNQYNCFQGKWWGGYPGAWRAAGWGTGTTAYSTATWTDCSSYGGSGGDPVYYDYGSNVVYGDSNVYVNGDAVATQEQYAQQATTIADTGKQAQATTEEEWLPLGVFAMIQGEQVNGNDLFQLTVNKSGVIRGNYCNALSDTTLPVYGSVDKKTQRAAWKVDDRKEPIFEAGFANLTRAQTTMLVHSKGGTQQWTLVRIDQPAKPK
jgi:hypothetical protein